MESIICYFHVEISQTAYQCTQTINISHQTILSCMH